MVTTSSPCTTAWDSQLWRWRSVYFPKFEPILLGGKCCTQGRAELRILWQDRAKRKASTGKDGGPVFWTFTATSLKLQSTFARAFCSRQVCYRAESQRSVFPRPSSTMTGARKSKAQHKQKAAQSPALDTGCLARRYGASAVPKSCHGNPKVNRFKLLLSTAREAVISSTEYSPEARYGHPRDVR